MVETLGAKRKERIKASRVETGEIINGCILTMCVFVGSVVSNSLQPLNCLPGSSIHGIFQARILEWAAISYSSGCPHPVTEPVSLAPPALVGGFYHCTTWETL